MSAPIKCETYRPYYRFFRNELNKFYNTGSRMLDPSYDRSLKSL